MGERNFGFDSLKYMHCDMDEKGIVALDCLPPEPHCPLPRGTTAAKHHRPAAGSGRFSLLQIDVGVEEPETLENPMQSF